MATSKNKAISISKFDVDPEGEHLNMIIDCPSDYKFTSLIITAYSALHGIKSAVTANFDGSLAVFGDDSTQHGDHYDIMHQILIEIQILSKYLLQFIECI